MAIAEVPTAAEPPSYVQVTDLGGRDFELRLDWRERAGAWYLDVRTAEGEAVALGLALAPGVRLLRRVVGDARPPGELVCTGEGALVGRTELGAAARLYYLDGDDLAAFVAAQEGES